MFQLIARFSVVLAILVLSTRLVSGASASTGEEACSVSRGPDGFIYKVHRPLAEVTREWETQDFVSLAKGHKFLPKQVKKVTNDSITLIKCRDYMRARWMESGIRHEAVCKVNCSALLNQEPPQLMVNSTQLCFIKEVCGWKASLCFTAIAVLAILAIILLVFLSFKAVKVCRRKCAAQQDVERGPYAPVELKTMQVDQQG